MLRSEYYAKSMSPETVTFFAIIQGQGAAVPVIPTPPNFPRGAVTSSKSVATKPNNFAASATRTSAGVYTLVLADSIPEILDIDPNVWGTDGKQVQIQDYNPVTRTISFSTFAANGTAATDLAATDIVRFTITGQLSIFT